MSGTCCKYLPVSLLFAARGGSERAMYLRSVPVRFLVAVSVSVLVLTAAAVMTGLP